MQAKQPCNKALGAVVCILQHSRKICSKALMVASIHQSRPANRSKNYMLNSLENCAQMIMMGGQDECIGLDCQGGGGAQEAGARKYVRAKLT